MRGAAIGPIVDGYSLLSMLIDEHDDLALVGFITAHNLPHASLRQHSVLHDLLPDQEFSLHPWLHVDKSLRIKVENDHGFINRIAARIK